MVQEIINAVVELNYPKCCLSAMRKAKPPHSEEFNKFMDLFATRAKEYVWKWGSNAHQKIACYNLTKEKSKKLYNFLWNTCSTGKKWSDS